jgi:hypothetical protein
MALEAREREGQSDGTGFDALVQRKIVLLERYLALTEEMRECLERNEVEGLGALLSRRRHCMEDVNKADFLLHKAGRDRMNGGAVEQNQLRIRDVLSRIEALERELLERMRTETETMKQELLKMQTARGAADKYRGHAEKEPRFLDVRDQYAVGSKESAVSSKEQGALSRVGSAWAPGLLPRSTLPLKTRLPRPSGSQ